MQFTLEILGHDYMWNTCFGISVLNTKRVNSAVLKVTCTELFSRHWIYTFVRGTVSDMNWWNLRFRANNIACVWTLQFVFDGTVYFKLTWHKLSEAPSYPFDLEPSDQLSLAW